MDQFAREVQCLDVEFDVCSMNRFLALTKILHIPIPKGFVRCHVFDRFRSGI